MVFFERGTCRDAFHVKQAFIRAAMALPRVGEEVLLICRHFGKSAGFKGGLEHGVIAVPILSTAGARPIGRPHGLRRLRHARRAKPEPSVQQKRACHGWGAPAAISLAWVFFHGHGKNCARSGFRPNRQCRRRAHHPAPSLPTRNRRPARGRPVALAAAWALMRALPTKVVSVFFGLRQVMLCRRGHGYAQRRHDLAKLFQLARVMRGNQKRFFRVNCLMQLRLSARRPARPRPFQPGSEAGPFPNG